MSTKYIEIPGPCDRLEEQITARASVRRLRYERLSSAVDEMVSRFDHCTQLIAEGKYNYEQAFNFCRPQAERCKMLKDDLLPEY